MNQIENQFIHTFIRKSRRIRLIHEFSAPEKRYRGLSRFNHEAEKLLEPTKVLVKGENLSTRREYLDFLAQNEEVCAFFSPDPSLDGVVLSPEAYTAKAGSAVIHLLPSLKLCQREVIR